VTILLTTFYYKYVRKFKLQLKISNIPFKISSKQDFYSFYCNVQCREDPRHYVMGNITATIANVQRIGSAKTAKFRKVTR
jgi:hypothetical protein